MTKTLLGKNHATLKNERGCREFFSILISRNSDIFIYTIKTENFQYFHEKIDFSGILIVKMTILAFENASNSQKYGNQEFYGISQVFHLFITKIFTLLLFQSDFLIKSGLNLSKKAIIGSISS